MNQFFTPDNLKAVATLFGIIVTIAKFVGPKILFVFKKLIKSKNSKIQLNYDKTVSYLEKYREENRGDKDPLELERATPLYVGNTQITVLEYDLFKHLCDLTQDYHDLDYMLDLYTQAKQYLSIDHSRSPKERVTYQSKMQSWRSRLGKKSLYALYYFLSIFAGIFISAAIVQWIGSHFTTVPSLIKSVTYILIVVDVSHFGIANAEQGKPCQQRRASYQASAQKT